MCLNKEFVSGLLSSLVGVLVGGAISSYVVFASLDKQLSFERARAASGFQLEMAGIKYSLYKEFLDKYGNISRVEDMHDKEWWELSELLAALNVVGDEKVAKSVANFYQAVSKVRNKMGSNNPANRQVYYEGVKTVVENMKNTLGIHNVAAHWVSE